MFLQLHGGQKALTAHWLSSILSLLHLFICFLFISLATAAEPGDATSSLQATGVICSEGLFGSPAVDVCRKQLSRLPKTDDYQWFESTDDFAKFISALPDEPCAIDVTVVPGAKNNATWNTITNIASKVIETCSATPGAPGGWGVYGTNSPISSPSGLSRCNGAIRLTRSAIRNS